MTNQEIVEQAYGHFAAGELPQMLALVAPDVRWTEPEGIAYRGTYIGPQAVVENVFARLAADWEVWEVRPETMVGDGDRVAVLGWYHGTHRESGRSMKTRFVHWWTVRDELITSFELVCDTAVLDAALPGR